MKLRKEVVKFAEFMEEVLQRYDSKGGWEYCSVEWLFLRLVEEVGELASQLSANVQTKAGITKECADVANFAMMIHDKVTS